jgi:hypothetical protein
MRKQVANVGLVAEPTVAGAVSTHLRTHVLLVCCAAFFACCTWDSHSHPGRKPDRGDLVGTWVPNARTIEDMRDRGGYDVARAKTKLVLRDDDSFEVVDMPDWWTDGFGRSTRSFQSFVGTWKLIPNANERGWGIALDMVSLDRNQAINLLGDKRPYSIYIIVGDPDRDDSMTFQMQSH